jgi:hypothetical protein
MRKEYDRALLNPFSQAGRGGSGEPVFDAGGFGDILSDHRPRRLRAA